MQLGERNLLTSATNGDTLARCPELLALLLSRALQFIPRRNRRLLLEGKHHDDQTPEYAGVITKFLQKIQENKPLEIYGDGLQTRDFVSIDDAVDSIHNAISKIEGKHGNIYNIASGKSISINDLAILMISLSEKNLNIIHSEPKKGDIIHSQADISLAKKELSYQPKIGLKDGIRNLMKE